MTLTPKQEAFCQAYIETGSATEAYRRHYNAENMKPQVIHVKACELLKSGKVAVRIENLRTAMMELNNLTAADLINELEEARIAAKGAKPPQVSAMVSATLGKARLMGILDPKTDNDRQSTAPIINIYRDA